MCDYETAWDFLQLPLIFLRKMTENPSTQDAIANDIGEAVIANGIGEAVIANDIGEAQ